MHDSKGWILTKSCSKELDEISEQFIHVSFIKTTPIINFYLRTTRGTFAPPYPLTHNTTCEPRNIAPVNSAYSHLDQRSPLRSMRERQQRTDLHRATHNQK